MPKVIKQKPYEIITELAWGIISNNETNPSKSNLQRKKLIKYCNSQFKKSLHPLYLEVCGDFSQSFTTVIKYYEQALKLCKSKNHPKYPIYESLGERYIDNDKLTEGLAYLRKALKGAKLSKNKSDVLRISQTIAESI